MVSTYFALFCSLVLPAPARAVVVRDHADEDAVKPVTEPGALADPARQSVAQLEAGMEERSGLADSRTEGLDRAVRDTVDWASSTADPESQTCSKCRSLSEIIRQFTQFSSLSVCQHAQCF